MSNPWPRCPNHSEICGRCYMCEPAEAKAMFDRMDDEIKEEKRMREQNDLRFRNRNPTAAAAAPAPASTPARAA